MSMSISCNNANAACASLMKMADVGSFGHDAAVEDAAWAHHPVQTGAGAVARHVPAIRRSRPRTC
jgi:hypothetical protein